MKMYEVTWETKQKHTKKFSGNENEEKAYEAVLINLGTKPGVIIDSIKIKKLGNKNER